MEASTRGDTESSEDFEFDDSLIDDLVSISYNSIMTEMKGKEITSSTVSKTEKSINLHADTDSPRGGDNFGDMDNISSQPLFVLDCVGNKNLQSKFEEDEDLESESKVEIYNSDNDDRKKTSAALPSDEDDDEESPETTTTHSKNVNKKNKRNSKYSLASSIDPHLDNLLPKGKTGVDKVFETRKLVDPTSEVVSERQKKKMNKEMRNKVCSDKWFNMKAPELTKDVKNQLSILQLREILDRKNFYKNNDRKKFPKFFQFGKVVENAADFYHARIPKKQRKATLLDEVMADADLKKYQKRKYAEIFGDAKKSRNKKKRKIVSK